MDTARPPLARPSRMHPPPPAPLSPTPSPSHDFSFTISFHRPPRPSPPPPPAAEVAPADDIFLHGHLLPLDVISAAARSSADSDVSCRPGPFDGRVGSDLGRSKYANATGSGVHEAPRRKPSPFFFGLGIWSRESNGNSRAGSSNMEDKKKGRKRGLDIGHLVRKYAAMVEQLFGFASSRAERERRELRRRPHSFSGRANPRERERWRRRRGHLSSAPASLRTSPANSGHLSVGASVKLSTSSDESTMEELQSAIQAAIAHCKNSIAVAKQEPRSANDEV